MPDDTQLQADYASLNELIVNCADFDRLEALLGGFNLFQVLKFEHGEIRHSNVLAWILDPTENHGLGDSFLKKWLMRTIHESVTECATPLNPADIDGWRIQDVEVRREWKNIDVLVVVNLVGGSQWVVCIENKVNSSQHSQQLTRYRTIVEHEFSTAGRMFVFLSKNEEEPEDEHYLPASYTQLHRTLRECVEGRSHSIGAEPRVLIDNYLRLLEEKFMDESEIARTALRIYQQHRRALDVIFEHKPDSIRDTSDAVREKLAAIADELGITAPVSNKFYVRFMPKAWDVAGNQQGRAWAGINATVLFEINISSTKARLYVISGKAPDAWIDPMWERSSSVPFKRSRRAARPRH
ncbi:PD-(D/E)XK nuclease family protein [Prosthecobacter sp.]|jgi:hypothetical protein|uniref:PD-(D/E)XK nuclease family protein n=1 Tax=Prosthecobacter sp. TaxID=1965333 RepID=UPI0037849A54